MTKTVFLFVILPVMFCTGFAQDTKKSNLEFYMDALDFYSPDSTKSRVDVYFDIPFTSVDFRKTKSSGTNFIAELDLTITIKDRHDSVIFTKVFKEELLTPKTDQSYLSRNSLLTTKNIFLLPGEYHIIAVLYELSTKNYSEKTQKITVHDFLSKPITISDVMTVSRINEMNGKKYITPLVSRNIGSLDTFYLFFFVYKNGNELPIEVNCDITNSAKEVFLNSEKILDMSNNVQFQNQIILSFPTNKLSYDTFYINITASSPVYKSVNTSELLCESDYFPHDLKEIDMLISQLQYIASDKELSYIKAGKTLTEKQNRFIDFWKSKDPNPNTKYNEVMVEYYRRVKYANEHFSTAYTPGWKSDMGMVYIIFGMPSNIERHPFELDSKPYEVWQYDELSREFIFVDETGFGDYRLVTPIWETFRYRN